MIKEFNTLKEIKKYYDKESNTYIFKEDGDYIDLVIFDFNLNVKANIDAYDIIGRDIKVLDIKALDIRCGDITALNIDAWDVNASDIKANDISYWAVCFAYVNIKCKSIKGRREKSKHFVLDGVLEVDKNVN